MTNTPGTPGSTPVQPVHTTHTHETKAFYKTSEFIFYILAVIAVLIASAVVDNGEDGQGFGADHAWLYVTLLTVGYTISRGLSKSGSHHRTRD
jgi:hypothetical protein